MTIESSKDEALTPLPGADEPADTERAGAKEMAGVAKDVAEKVCPLGPNWSRGR